MSSTSSTLPATQKAWLIERRGVPSHALSFRTNVPVPTKLQPGEVLVKVHAAALNPIGYKLMQMLPNWLEARPRPAEHDLAGEIVDSNGTNFSNGDKVFGFISYPLSRKIKQGALAEYVRMPADHLVIRPGIVTATEAAGFTLAGQTAYQMVFHAAKVEAGQTIFVNGGSTSVGAFAIQMAKANGVNVVASASGKNEDLVKGLGAEFVDYTKTPLHEHFSKNPPRPKFHAIIDAAGLSDPALYTNSANYLAPEGTFVTVGPSSFAIGGLLNTAFALLRPRWLGGTPRKHVLVRLSHNPADLEAMRVMIAEGKLKPVVDSVYPFQDTLKAYDRILTSRARGKVVVKVAEDAT